MRYAGEKKLNIWVAMALGILALFLLFVVYPLVLVLYKSVLSEDGNLSFAYFTKFFARKYYWSTLVNSFKVTIVSTLVAAFLGLAMAERILHQNTQQPLSHKAGRHLWFCRHRAGILPPVLPSGVHVHIRGPEESGQFPERGS